jgi:hypothetical protein
VIIQRFNCPANFLVHAAPYLESQEAVKNLFLGVVVRLGEEHYEEKAFMASVQQEDLVGLAGLYFRMNLLLSHGKVAAIPALAEELSIGGWNIPGVLGPFDLVESFASVWTERLGCTSTLWVQQRIFRLDQDMATRALQKLSEVSAEEVD